MNELKLSFLVTQEMVIFSYEYKSVIFIFLCMKITMVYDCCFLLPAGYVLNTTLAPAFGLPFSPHAAAEAEKTLLASLGTIESFWLQGNGNFLVGNTQPSIADLSLVCELMQLEVRDILLMLLCV